MAIKLKNRKIFLLFFIVILSRLAGLNSFGYEKR